MIDDTTITNTPISVALTLFYQCQGSTPGVTVLTFLAVESLSDEKSDANVRDTLPVAGTFNIVLDLAVCARVGMCAYVRMRARDREKKKKRRGRMANGNDGGEWPGGRGGGIKGIH